MSSSKMGFLAHVALNDPTPGKRMHSMTPPSEQLKEISQVALNDPSLRTLDQPLWNLDQPLCKKNTPR